MPMIDNFIQGLSLPVLFGLIAVCILVLGTSADWLVREAVALSERSGISKVVIGATIVSLGTTTPEAAVSVLSALQGQPELALGNAVGSIICDTGLILGLACLVSPLPLPPTIVNRQGWLQLGAGVLLVALAWPWGAPLAAAFTEGGSVPQWAGFLLVALLVGYLWLSVRWARREKRDTLPEELEIDVKSPMPVILMRLIAAIVLVVASSHVLIPSVSEAAKQIGIPPGVIAATLVAFGTSLPELTTALTAAWRRHGDLAVGNIVGADILNVLFVAGAAAAVTPDGLDASPYFFRVLFPGMLFLLIVFRVGILFPGPRLERPFGFILLAAYVAVMVATYVFR